MTRHRRPSGQTAAVLRALAQDPASWRYGYDLCSHLGIQPGSMYPILIRLADRGLLETRWEADRVAGRPARHLYRLSSAGRAYVTETVLAVPAPPKARLPRPAPTTSHPALVTRATVRPQPGGGA